MFTTAFCFFFQFVLCWPTIFEHAAMFTGVNISKSKNEKKKKGCFGLRMDNLSPPSTDWTQRAHYPRLTDCFSLCTCHPAFVYNVRYRVIFCARVRARMLSVTDVWVESSAQVQCQSACGDGGGGGGAVEWRCGSLLCLIRWHIRR